MKKFILMMALLIGTTTMVFGQQTTVEGSKFFDNTYINLNVGDQMGMHNFTGVNQYNSTSRWSNNPSLSLYLGKWVTPILGIEINGDMLCHPSFKSNNKFVDVSYLGLALKVNLNNVFHGYRVPCDRVEVMPFVGFGWLHAFGDTQYADISRVDGSERIDVTSTETTLGYVGRNNLATKMGIDICINLGKTRAGAVTIRPSVMFALTNTSGSIKNEYKFNGIKYDSRYGRVGLEVGAKYTFGHKNSKGEKVHCFTPAYTAKEYEDLLAQKNKVETITKVDTIYVTKVEVNEVEVVKKEYAIPSPYFKQGKADLDPTTNQVLTYVADEINKDGGKWEITGYASTEGSEAVNNALSQKRAEVVKDALVKLGVNPDLLNVVAGGATDKFGQLLEQNRTVTVTKD